MSLARSLGVSVGKLYTLRTYRTAFPFLPGGNYSPLSRPAVSHFALFSRLKRWLSAVALAIIDAKSRLGSAPTFFIVTAHPRWAEWADGFFVLILVSFFHNVSFFAFPPCRCLFARQRRVVCYGNSCRRLLLSCSVLTSLCLD